MSNVYLVRGCLHRNEPEGIYSAMIDAKQAAYDYIKVMGNSGPLEGGGLIYGSKDITEDETYTKDGFTVDLCIVKGGGVSAAIERFELK